MRKAKVLLVIMVSFLLNFIWTAPAAHASPSGTTRVSTDSSNNEVYTGASLNASTSSDGRYVVFTSSASDLVASDTNSTTDVFLKDTSTGSIQLVSVSTAGIQGNGFSGSAKISANGKYVVFSSSATNLVSGDTNAKDDAFLRDIQNGTTELVSKSTSGTLSNGFSNVGDVSENGRYVVFDSAATNLVSGDTNGFTDIFVRDRLLGTTRRISVSDSGTQSDGNSSEEKISCNGSLIVFSSSATNIVSGDTNGVGDIFVLDRVADHLDDISITGNGASDSPSVSCKGSDVAFNSASNNLVAGDTNGFTDDFVYNIPNGSTQRVSISSSGAQGNNTVSDKPVVSDDGSIVSFTSTATNMIASDTNGQPDVFIRDMNSGTTELISFSTLGAPGNNNSGQGVLSTDNHYVVFFSRASDLVSSDTNSFADVFKTDTGKTTNPCQF